MENQASELKMLMKEYGGKQHKPRIIAITSGGNDYRRFC